MPRRPVLVKNQVHGTRDQDSFDSSAVPILLYRKPVQQLDKWTNLSSRKIAAANEGVPETLGPVSDREISFQDIQALPDIFVIDNQLLGVIIGPPELDSLQAEIDIETQTATIEHKKKRLKQHSTIIYRKQFLPEIEVGSEEFTAES